MTATLTAKLTHRLGGGLTADDGNGNQADLFESIFADELSGCDAIAHKLLTIEAGDWLRWLDVSAAAYTLWGETFTRDFAEVRAIYVENLGTLPEQQIAIGGWVDSSQYLSAIWPTAQRNTEIGPGDVYALTAPVGYEYSGNYKRIYIWPPAGAAYAGPSFTVRAALLGVAA